MRPGGNGGARRNGPNLEGGPTVSSRVGSPPYAKVRETAISRALGSEVTLAACADGETRFPAVRHGATVRVENPSVHSGVRPWNGRAREGFLRGRHVRSTCRRSVRPAIHVPSRGSPRSSSTGEPSDPPFGALHSELNALFTRVPSSLPTKLGKTRTTEGDASETEVPKDGASRCLARPSPRTFRSRTKRRPIACADRRRGYDGPRPTKTSRPEVAYRVRDQTDLSPSLACRSRGLAPNLDRVWLTFPASTNRDRCQDRTVIHRSELYTRS